VMIHWLMASLQQVMARCACPDEDVDLPAVNSSPYKSEGTSLTRTTQKLRID